MFYDYDYCIRVSSFATNFSLCTNTYALRFPSAYPVRAYFFTKFFVGSDDSMKNFFELVKTTFAFLTFLKEMKVPMEWTQRVNWFRRIPPWEIENFLRTGTLEVQNQSFHKGFQENGRSIMMVNSGH